MRQLKLQYGVLIGKAIQVFYDGDLADYDYPVLLESIEFERASTKGLKFVELFSKETFNYDSLKEYASAVLKKINRKEEQKRLQQKILSSGFNSELFELIKLHFIDKHDAEIIDNALQEISISISLRDQPVIEKRIMRATTPEKKSTNNSKDKTKYIINGNGKILPKNRFVLEFVRAYVQKFPSNYETLKTIFKDSFQGSTGVINRLDYVQHKYANKTDKRHFVDPKDVLVSKDNVAFVVSDQWAIGTVKNIVSLARKSGFDVQEILGD